MNVLRFRKHIIDSAVSFLTSFALIISPLSPIIARPAFASEGGGETDLAPSSITEKSQSAFTPSRDLFREMKMLGSVTAPSFASSSAPVGSALLQASAPAPAIDFSWSAISQQSSPGTVSINGKTMTIVLSTQQDVSAKAVLDIRYNNWSDQPAGSVAIDIPKHIAVDRNGNTLGELELPRELSANASPRWSVSEYEDKITLINKRPLQGVSTADMIEFTYKGITPSEVISGKSMTSKVSVISSSDAETQVFDSPLISLVLDTDDPVVTSVKTQTINVNGSWPQIVPKPENWAADNYVLASVNATIARTGCQYSSLYATFSPASSGISGGQVLGYSINGQFHSDTENVLLESNNFTRSSSCTFYVLYPRDKSFDTSYRKYGGAVTAKVVTTDDAREHESTGENVMSYRISVPPAPSVPEISTPKPVDPPQGVVERPAVWVSPRNAISVGKGTYRLESNGKTLLFPADTLVSGSVLDASFLDSFHMTTLYQTRDGSASDRSSYHKKDVSVSGQSNGLSLNGSTLSSSDYHIESLTMDQPKGYVYNGYEEKWSTLQFGTTPLMTLISIDESDKETVIAQVQWVGNVPDIASKVPYSVSSTKSVSFSMPEGAVRYRWEAIAGKTSDGIYLRITPHYSIFPTEKVTSLLSSIPKTSESKLRGSLSASACPVDDTSVISTANTSAEQRLSSMYSNTKLNVDLYSTTETDSGFEIKGKITADWKSNAPYSSVPEGFFPSEGVFAMLLPEGATIDTKTVCSGTSGMSIGRVKQVRNYNGTRQTLVTIPSNYVRAASGGTMTVSFNLKYDYSSYRSYGGNLSIQGGFAASAPSLSNYNLYEQNDPLLGQFAPASYQAVYATGNAVVHSNLSMSFGLFKNVAAGDGVYSDGRFQDEINVYLGQEYSYRLSLSNADVSPMTSITLFDAIESYEPVESDEDFKDERWKGTFRSVDVSELVEKGAAPIVYYSTVDGLDLSNGESDDLDLSKSEIWSSKIPADPSSVKAIAIDCSTSSDGTPFELDYHEDISAYIDMIAPSSMSEGAYDETLGEDESEEGLAGGSHAYNEVSASYRSDDIAEGNKLIVNSYTKIGIVDYGVSVDLVWDDENNNDGLRPQYVTARLYEEGSPTDITVRLDENNGWKADFDFSPRYDEAGLPLIYEVKVDEIPSYSKYLSYTESYRKLEAHIEAVHIPIEHTITIFKNWENLDLSLSFAPVSKVKVNVFADYSDEPVAQAVVEDKGRYWVGYATVRTYHEGKLVTYTCQEEEIESYTPEYRYDGDTVYITNSFHPYGTIIVNKTGDETVPDASKDGDNVFSIELRNPGGDVIYNEIMSAYKSTGEEMLLRSGTTFTLKIGESIRIEDIPRGVKATVEETKCALGQKPVTTKQSIENMPAKTIEWTFENSYSCDTTWYPKIKKVLTGKTMEPYEFQFRLVNTSTLESYIGYNDANGVVSFPGITFTKEDSGKTFYYQLREVNRGRKGYTYDTDNWKSLRVTATPVDNGNGTMSINATWAKYANNNEFSTLTFHNKYSAEGDIVLHAKKRFPGLMGMVESWIPDSTDPAVKADFLSQQIPAGWFAFEYFTNYAINGSTTMPAYDERPVNDSDGNIVFDPITITSALDKKTLQFTIKEASLSLTKTKIDADGQMLGIPDLYTRLTSVMSPDPGKIYRVDVSTSYGEMIFEPLDAIPVLVNKLSGTGEIIVEKQVAEKDEEAAKNENFDFHIDITSPDESIELPELSGTKGEAKKAFKIIFDADGGTFEDGTDMNSIKYMYHIGKDLQQNVKRIYQSSHPARATSYSTSIQIPGAPELHVSIWSRMDTYASNYQSNSVFYNKGTYCYSTSGNYLGYARGGGNDSNKNTKPTSVTRTATIPGDKVAFYANNTNSSYYGFYAEVTASWIEDPSGYENTPIGEVKTPSKTGKVFCHWVNPDTGEIVLDPLSIEPSDTGDVYLKAVYVPEAPLSDGWHETANGSLRWGITADGTLLIIPLKEGAAIDNIQSSPSSATSWPWDAYRNSITKFDVNDHHCELSSGYNISYMFDGCANLVDTSGFSKVKWYHEYATTGGCITNYMFRGCSSLVELKGFEQFNLYKAMGMFMNCTSLLYMDGDALGSNSSNETLIEDIDSIFSGCTNLRSATFIANYPRSYNVSLSSYYRANAFTGCDNLARIAYTYGSKNPKATVAATASSSAVSYSRNRDFMSAIYASAKSSPIYTETLHKIDSAGNTSEQTFADFYKRLGGYSQTLPNGLTMKYSDITDYGTKIVLVAPSAPDLMVDSTDAISTASTSSFADSMIASTFSILTAERVPATEGETATENNSDVEENNIVEDASDVMPIQHSEEEPFAQADDEPSAQTDESVISKGMDFSLKAGEMIRIPDIPTGSHYTVYEKSKTGWKLIESSNTSGIINSGEIERVSFENESDAASAQYMLSGTKNMSDGSIPQQYPFILKDSTGNKIQQVFNSGNTFVFEPITFEQAGTYTYTIEEGDIVNADKVDKDAHKETITFKVLNTNGQLSVSAVTDADGIAFENKVKTASVTVRNEILSGDQTLSFPFTIEIGNSVETFQLGHGEEKTFQLTPGMQYKVYQNKSPWDYYTSIGSEHSGAVAGGDALSFDYQQKYTATGKGFVKAKVTLSGRPLRAGEFKFNLLSQDGKVLDTVTNGPDGYVEFLSQNVTTDEPSIPYAIEQVDTGDKTVIYDLHDDGASLNGTDNGDGTMSVDTVYNITEGIALFENQVLTSSLTVHNSFDDRTDWADDNEEAKYTLSFTDVNGYPIDPSDIEVLAVIDDDTHELYNISTPFILKNDEYKTFIFPSGVHWKIEQHPVESAEILNNALVSLPFTTTVSNDENGETSTFKEDTIIEGDAAANNNDHAWFINKRLIKYLLPTFEQETTTLTPTAKKLLLDPYSFNGIRDLYDGQFSFQLVNSNGAVLSTSSNDAEGNVLFGDMVFDAEDIGEHTFYVREIINDADDEIIYDKNEYPLIVNVSYDETEEIVKAEQSVDIPVFENSIQQTAISLPLTGERASVLLLLCGIILVIAGLVNVRSNMIKKKELI